MFCADGVSVAGPLVAADAPPANDKDIPATPNTGMACVRRFRFEASFVCDISRVLHTFEQMFDEWQRDASTSYILWVGRMLAE